MKKSASAVLFCVLLSIFSPAFGQSTADQTQPGYLTTSGCSSGGACFKPYSSANPLPVGVYSSSGSSGYVFTSNGAGQLATFQPLDTNVTSRVVGVTIDGMGSTPGTGVKGYFRVPYSGTITGWTMLADQSGSAVIDVWNTLNAIPTVANTITAAALPTLSSQQYVTSNTLTGWNTTVAAGDVFGFNLNSATTVTRITLELYITAN